MHVRYCCVVNCKNNSKKNRSLSFHCFPSEDRVRKKWESVLRIRKSTPEMRVCSDHFHPSDYFSASKPSQNMRRRIKKRVIPSRKLPLDQKQKCEIPELKTGQSDRSSTEMSSEPTVKKEDDTECRLCLRSLMIDEDLYSLLEPWKEPWDGMESTMADDLMRLTNIEINQSDMLSTTACSMCYCRLKESSDFVKFVLRNDNVLKERSRTVHLNVSSESMWPQPISVDQNVADASYNMMDVEVKQEVISDGEEANTSSQSGADIKIEPEEIQPQVNGTTSPCLKLLNEKKTSEKENNEFFEQEEYLDSTIKEEPLSDEGSCDLPLDCMLCLRKFQRISGLKAHVLACHSYTSVKRKSKNHVSPVKKLKTAKYVCDTCRRSFETSTELMVHETCHSSLSCYVCNTKIDSFHQLARHRKKCKGDTGPAKIKTLSDVLRPMPVKEQSTPTADSESKETLEKCADCNETFTDEYYLKIHREILHSASSQTSIDGDDHQSTDDVSLKLSTNDDENKMEVVNDDSETLPSLNEESRNLEELKESSSNHVSTSNQKQNTDLTAIDISEIENESQCQSRDMSQDRESTNDFTENVSTMDENTDNSSSIDKTADDLSKTNDNLENLSMIDEITENSSTMNEDTEDFSVGILSTINEVTENSSANEDTNGTIDDTKDELTNSFSEDPKENEDTYADTNKSEIISVTVIGGSGENAASEDNLQLITEETSSYHEKVINGIQNEREKMKIEDVETEKSFILNEDQNVQEEEDDGNILEKDGVVNASDIFDSIFGIVK